MLKASNNKQGDLYRAYLEFKRRIKNVEVDQNFFVQNFATYLMILEQSFIMTMRMETKFLHNDFYYVKIRDYYKKILMQLFTIRLYHE